MQNTPKNLQKQPNDQDNSGITGTVTRFERHLAT
jgi:hypothetical protein